MDISHTAADLTEGEKATVERIMPIVADRIRGDRLVPNTLHWANWHDADANRYHGISIEPRYTGKKLTIQQIAIALVVAGRIANGLGDDLDLTSYDDLFLAGKEFGLDVID